MLYLCQGELTVLDLNPVKNVKKQADTLETLISNLDQRGVLVLLVLLGQQAMSVLSQKHIEKVTKPSVLKPD
jgi:hypothetical protein